MRESCARVLAAALMTGAIAFALAFPVLFGAAPEVGRELTAPPSSLQRSVHVPVPAAPVRPARAERLVRARSVHPPADGRVLVRHAPSQGAVPSPRSVRPSTQGKPARPEAPKPETRELTSTTASEAAPAPTGAASAGSPTPGSDPGKKHKGKGKAKGKGKQSSGDAPTAPMEPEGPSTPAGEQTSEPAGEHGTGNDNGNANGHGHGKGHGKGHQED